MINYCELSRNNKNNNKILVLYSNLEFYYFNYLAPNSPPGAPPHALLLVPPSRAGALARDLRERGRRGGSYLHHDGLVCFIYTNRSRYSIGFNDYGA